MYENNIKQHYIEYVERYVNVVWEQKFITNKIRKIKKTKKDRETSVRSLNMQLRKIKNDLLNLKILIINQIHIIINGFPNNIN